MMPLSYAEPGKPVHVVKIAGPEKIRRHLADLGFAAQSVVTIRQKIAGSLIVDIRGTRLALDAGMARHICIREDQA